MSQVCASIAVVARKESGGIVKAWASIHPICEPIEAEAASIVGALNLAIEEKFLYIEIEGDAKLCFDELNGDVQNCHWIAKTWLLNAVELKTKCCSCWVKRECNAVAHALAKVVSPLSPVFKCNNDSLPSDVWEAWEMMLVDSISLVG